MNDFGNTREPIHAGFIRYGHKRRNRSIGGHKKPPLSRKVLDNVHHNHRAGRRFRQTPCILSGFDGLLDRIGPDPIQADKCKGNCHRRQNVRHKRGTRLDHAGKRWCDNRQRRANWSKGKAIEQHLGMGQQGGTPSRNHPGPGDYRHPGAIARRAGLLQGEVIDVSQLEPFQAIVTRSIATFPYLLDLASPFAAALLAERVWIDLQHSGWPIHEMESGYIALSIPG